MKTLPNPTVQENGTLDQDSKRKYTQLMTKLRSSHAITPEETEFASKCVNLMNQGNLSASMVSQEEAERVFKEARNEDGLLDPSKLPPKKLNPDLKLNAAGTPEGNLAELNEDIKSIQPDSLEFTDAEGEAEIRQEQEMTDTPEAKTAEEVNEQMVEEARKAVRTYLDERIAEVPGLAEKIKVVKSEGSKVQARIIDGETLFVHEIMRRNKHREFQLRMAQTDQEIDIDLETLKSFCIHPDFNKMTAAQIDELVAGEVISMVQIISVASGFNTEISIPFDL